MGGLSVLRHAWRHLPETDFLYFADSAHAPYGDRAEDWVRERTLWVARYLSSKGADALVIACNTATALAAEVVRASLDVPVIAMEPAIKPAAARTRSGVIAVLATASTLSSQRYRDLRQRFANGIEVLEYAPHHWVARIEQGAEADDEFAHALQQELRPIARRGVDTWVLACTHFPLIQEQIRQALGGDPCLIDPAPAVSAELARRLGLHADDSTGAGKAGLTLFTTGDPQRLTQRARQWLGLRGLPNAIRVEP
jgi:glutamate racemase